MDDPTEAGGNKLGRRAPVPENELCQLRTTGARIRKPVASFGRTRGTEAFKANDHLQGLHRSDAVGIFVQERNIHFSCRTERDTVALPLLCVVSVGNRKN
ncbi:hypothetical protein PoB_001916800 [Plakobranchus ocellatus]|uniref:Uncharacterized protein n=1 Tax=Plakobranchus ocellatus TaxID=259542 RepID=A0AAV3ZDY2_9GAST|nr:hypothetical protein PoB_001916800 [Plakobranchus ocellatus]